MIVRPREETPKLGRKNIDARTEEEAIAVYRKRFAPLADDVDLIVEGQKDVGRSTVDTLGENTGTDTTGDGGPSIDGANPG